MKRYYFIILAFMCYGHKSAAQNCDDRFLGTKTLYKNITHKNTPAPAGYKPVFINHVGRHGARHLTKDVNTSLAYALLFKADSINALTPKGKRLKQMVIDLQSVEKGSTKSISAEGRDELSGLGERMYKTYKNVFTGRNNLNVAITKEVRTKQSADAFLTGLKIQIKNQVIVKEYNDDTSLRFYDLSPAYKTFEDNIDHSDLITSLEKTEHLAEMNSAFMSDFFTVDFLNSINDDVRSKFTTDIFGFTTIVYSLNAEIREAGLKPADLDFKSFFTCKQLDKLALMDAADGYLKKGPGIDNNGIQVRIAVPLMVDFIKTADQFIKTGDVNAQLRFAHAETIAPFAAFLQISAADKATKVMTKINQFWEPSAIIPLSSNIQWIFYKKAGTTGYLVKILLNEQEASITGLSKRSSVYLRWSELRAFYINKLIKLNVKLNDDMSAYLANLK